MLTTLIYLLKLVPLAVLSVFLLKLANWIYLTVWIPKELDLSAYGSRPKNSLRSLKAWALITGASDGIGAAFARELAQQRFNLFLVGRNMDKLEAVRNEIISRNNDIKVVCLISEASDASNENILRLFQRIEEVLAPLKGNCLRILINNVGMGQNGKRRLGDIDVLGGEGGLFEEIVKVNCVYPVLLTRAFLQRIKVTDGRVAVINLASCAALTPATPFSSLYAATKSFNRSFSLSLAAEMSAKRLLHPDMTPQCDVICVNPGFVSSNMTKMKKSLYCCTSDEHSHVVFSKITRSQSVVDIIPHWKHGLMWSVLACLETLIPSEWFLVAVIMPAVLKLSGKFRNFKID